MNTPLLIRVTGVMMIIRIGGRCACAAVRAFVIGVGIVLAVVPLVVCLVAPVRVVGAATSEVERVGKVGD